MNEAAASDALARIAAALERLAPPPARSVDLAVADAFVWEAQASGCGRCRGWPACPTTSCAGSSAWPRLLYENTRRFAAGLPANNALLWGARGMGKSSLVKAIHARLNEARPARLVLIEIHREDIESLPRLLHLLADSGRRCLLFCDDLSLRRRRDQLQVAQGRARGRDRGPARQRPVLRHLEPPPPDAAPDDRQRAQHRDPPRRGGRGEGVAVRPVRPLARLPPLQPGDLSRHGRALRRAFRPGDRRPTSCGARRWNGPRRAAAARAGWRGS